MPCWNSPTCASFGHLCITPCLSSALVLEIRPKAVFWWWNLFWPSFWVCRQGHIAIVLLVTMARMCEGIMGGVFFFFLLDSALQATLACVRTFFNKIFEILYCDSFLGVLSFHTFISQNLCWAFCLYISLWWPWPMLKVMREMKYILIYILNLKLPHHWPWLFALLFSWGWCWCCCHFNNNNKSIFKGQNLVPRDCSKHARTHTHTLIL